MYIYIDEQNLNEAMCVRKRIIALIFQMWWLWGILKTNSQIGMSIESHHEIVMLKNAIHCILVENLPIIEQK